MTHCIHASSSAILLTLGAVAGVLIGSACSSPAADSAATSQREANATIREAKLEASKTATKARSKEAEAQQAASEEAAEAAQEANAAVAEANQKARGKGAVAQANANVEVRKANRATAKAMTDLREWSQQRLDYLDNAIDAARAKEQTAAPKLRASFEAGMKAVEVRRDALRADAASIVTQSAKEMADFKQRFEREGDQLKERVDQLSAAL